MLSVPDHPLRLNVFLYISQSPLTSVRSAVQFKLLPWLFLLQEDRNGLPGCMERIQLLLGVSCQKPKRNWLMIGLSRENKKCRLNRLHPPGASQMPTQKSFKYDKKGSMRKKGDAKSTKSGQPRRCKFGHNYSCFDRG